MFRKLFALEVEAIASYDNAAVRAERSDNELLSSVRDAFTPRTGSYGSMWATHSPR